MANQIKIGILGTCPVCEGEYKVRKGKLVHHGFTRPGDGIIHGDCYAVDYEPYERSTKGCVDYKASVKFQLHGLQDRLRNLTEGKVTHFTKLSWDRRDVEYALGVTDAYTWERIVEEEIHGTSYHIQQCEREIARMDGLIAAWSLKELREVTEEAATAQLKAEREARHLERQAKRAYIDAIVVELIKLAPAAIPSGHVNHATKAKARTLLAEFKSPKNIRKFGHTYGKELNCDELLIWFGLAERSETGHVYYGF